MKRVRVTLVPLVVAVAAFFVVLPRTGGDATIAMRGDAGSFAFEPSRLEAGAGARIRLVNETDATHSVTAIDDAFDLVLQPGQSRFLERAGTGSIEFFCRFHGASDEMSGTLVLGDA